MRRVNHFIGDKLHAAIKLLVGIILLALGIWLVIPSAWIPMIKPFPMFNWGSELVTVLKGVIPALLVLIGVLIIWIESEELKAPEVE